MLKHELIDGQEVILVEDEDWNRLRDDPSMEGIVIALPIKDMDYQMDIVRAHAELAMGFRLIRKK